MFSLGPRSRPSRTFFLRWVWPTLISAGALSSLPTGQNQEQKLDFSEYQAAVDKIRNAVEKEHQAYARLAELCYDIGPRLSGSVGLERAVVWAQEKMREDGLVAVAAEPVMVPHWVRGEESVVMITPHQRRLPMLGLGGSVGTPPGGISAEVEVVEDEAGLEALGAGAAGKIVLFNNPMPPYSVEEGAGYGHTVRFRINGARLAAEHGAVACLIRSVTARSLNTPHTGVMHYGDATTKIPAAALTIEDAEMIANLRARGLPVRLELEMNAQDLGEAESANVVGELRGREKPEEIVVLGGHLDSWDVGQGAQDDGGPCVAAMEAVAVLKRIGLQPRRTIRVVLWTNEENGSFGGRAYAEQHAAELAQTVAAIESDSGVFMPAGIAVDLEDDEAETRAAEQLEGMIRLLEATGLRRVQSGHSAADVSHLRTGGVPVMGFETEGEKYFDYHHTPADTFDKVDSEELTQNVIGMAALVYLLAEMPGRLGE